MDSYTDASGRSCGRGCGQRSVSASNCRSNRCGSAATPDYSDMTTFPWNSWEYNVNTPNYAFLESSVTQPGGMACTQTAPGCLEQQFPVAMAYVPWQQWQTTYAPERGLLQGTIFPDLDLEFNYGRCGR